jgi:hypothetical protein
LHGGDLRIQSAKGAGTRVSVFIPLVTNAVPGKAMADLPHQTGLQ